ncbi:MAG: hypothetical protein UY48_C0001G0017 [Candidatus Gottesmanbacteria bacterium GW2011_GWB1_49_7]|uniref:Uncharacterized protein n=1 Tax=Candidatus Gottesmanbacteria bacterium GW2011_GWB1_49_7 TaxID=1618448 RepID=A0A0G1W3Q0_9BACT|nr:MAG: hypothetical protein UY48_C0001G0017 [Candidatus Gottesmanbacteria bacterium GW2011_GWB1_49_7]
MTTVLINDNEINDEFLKLEIERIDNIPKSTLIKIRVRGEKEWLFYQFRLYEGQGLVFRDNGKDEFVDKGIAERTLSREAKKKEVIAMWDEIE